MVTAKDFVGVDFSEALSRVRGGPPAAAFNTAPTPQELHTIYSRGFQGVRNDRQTPESKKKFSDMMAAMPTLYEAFPWAKGLGAGKLLMPWVCILKLFPEWGGDDAQERGDCTVHGTAHAGAIDYGIDALFGETKFKGNLACENIYRSRGFSGDGWSCEAPCTYVGPNGDGGFLYRQVWSNGSDSVDLSKYNPSWEGNGNAGVPKWMEEESKKCKVKWVVPITNPGEYFDALALGFGINVCSGQGFSSSTDELGVASAQGSWSHSMAHTGADSRDAAKKKYGGDGLGLIQQSWGKWNTQNGRFPDSPPWPIGAFGAKMSVINDRMLGDDSFALCGVWGWDRTNWEAFNITDYKSQLLKHLDSRSDYYMNRHKWLMEYQDKAAAELNMFSAI